MIKEEFYKTIRINKNEYGLEKALGYKVNYTDYTGARITLFFEKVNDYWNITEYETGASVGCCYDTLKQAKEQAEKRIDIIRNNWNNETTKMARKIKFDLLCKC